MLTTSSIIGRSLVVRPGVRLEYVESGDPGGPPVVLLHGVTDSWRSFEDVLAHIPASIRAIAVSQRGHGESSRPETGYRIDDMADDLLGLMDALGLPAAILVGHSMGSFVVQRFAADHPQRTRGVVLMGSAPGMHTNIAVREMVAALDAMADPSIRPSSASSRPAPWHGRWIPRCFTRWWPRV